MLNYQHMNKCSVKREFQWEIRNFHKITQAQDKYIKLKSDEFHMLIDKDRTKW